MKIPLPLFLLLAASIDATANRATRRTKKSAPIESPLRQSVDLKTASRRTGIAYSTLRQWISCGDLPAYRVNGKRVRVYVEDLDALFVRVGQ